MRPKLSGVTAALFLTMSAATFESAMLFAALPKLIREFGDPVTAGWLVTIHSLIGAAIVIVVGRLGDIYGRRGVLLVLLLIAIAGSVLSAVTSSFAIVLIGRAMQGASVPVLPLTIGIVRESMPANRVPVVIGIMGTAQGVGVAVGLILGGAIVDHWNWHWLFAASAVLLAASWLAVRLLVPARPGVPPSKPINWLQGVLPVPGIILLLLGISFSKQLGWLDPRIWGAIFLGLAIVALWARRSLREHEPFIDLRLLATRNVAIANVISALLAISTMQMIFLFSNYAQSPAWTMVGLGLSATAAGLINLPSNVVAFLGGPLSGWLTQKRGISAPLLIGGGIAAAGWLWGLMLPTSFVEVIFAVCIVSFGTAMLNSAIPNVIVASVPDERTGEAIGSLSVIRGMASSLGVQFIAVLLTTEAIVSPDGVASMPSATGYRVTMAWIIALTVISALIALLLRVRRVVPGAAAA
jgi:MFS family permease